MGQIHGRPRSKCTLGRPSPEGRGWCSEIIPHHKSMLGELKTAWGQVSFSTSNCTTIQFQAIPELLTVISNHGPDQAFPQAVRYPSDSLNPQTDPRTISELSTSSLCSAWGLGICLEIVWGSPVDRLDIHRLWIGLGLGLGIGPRICLARSVWGTVWGTV